MRKKTTVQLLIFLSTGLLISASSFFIFMKVDFGSGLFKYFLSSERQVNLVLLPCLAPQVNHQCLSEKLPGLFKTYGVSLAMEAFENHIKRAGETFSSHEAAHRLGEAVYAFTSQDPRKALALCTTAAHYGCSHAVWGAFASRENIPLREFQNLPGLCAESSQSLGAYSLCIHGLGHALLVDRGGEVPLALVDCDTLRLDSGTSQACYTGIFMENASNIMGGGGKYLSSGDPLFPCNMEGMNAKYIPSCYWQLILPAADAFEICRKAPQEWKWACAGGIGINIASLRADFPDSIIRRCAGGGADLKMGCLVGAASYLKLGDNDNQTTQLCEKLIEEEKTLACGKNLFQNFTGTAK